MASKEQWITLFPKSKIFSQFQRMTELKGKGLSSSASLSEILAILPILPRIFFAQIARRAKLLSLIYAKPLLFLQI